MPATWPWGLIPKEPEPAAPEIKSKGRGRGRGRGRGKDSKSEDVEPKIQDSKEKDKAEKAKKGPFLLTNLVRVGNQMRGASTWSILQNALQKVIEQKLLLLPFSSRPQSAHDHLKFNIEILIQLGKLPSSFKFNEFECEPDQHGTANSKKQSELVESASELLRRHMSSNKCTCHLSLTEVDSLLID